MSMTILPIFTTRDQSVTSYAQALDEKIANRQSILDSNTNGTSYLDCNAADFIRTEKKAYELISQGKQNTLLLSRQQVILDSVETIKDFSNQLSVLLTSVGITGPKLDYIYLQATNILEIIQQFMNIEYNNERLFSGTANDQLAVKNLIDLPRLSQDIGIVDYSYYVGGEKGGKIEIYDDIDFERYPVTAKDDAFAKTIHAARLCLTITDVTNIGNDQVYQTACSMIQSALVSDFPIVTYNIEIGKNKLNNAITRAESQIIIEKEQNNNSNYIDQIQALNDLTMLQASKDNALNILIKQSILDRKLYKEIIDSVI